MALYGRTTMLKIQAGVDDSATFTAGNVSGKIHHQGEQPHLGWLPEKSPEWAARFRSALNAGDVYAFYSYETPIAWKDHTGNWTQPPVKYSPSTTNHQSTVAGFIGGYGHVPAQHMRHRSMADFSARRPVAEQPVPDQHDTRHDTPETWRVLDNIDQTLAEVAADGWTNPFTDPDSPARKLAEVSSR